MIAPKPGEVFELDGKKYRAEVGSESDCISKGGDRYALLERPGLCCMVDCCPDLVILEAPE